MRPSPDIQVRWGLAASGLAILLLLILAFVPDPFFRQRVFVTSFDDVDLITSGASVYFQGAEVGEVRSVKLDPASRTFAVRLGVQRDWLPTDCAFVRIHEINPLTAPRIELVDLDTPTAACPAARRAGGCSPLGAPSRGGSPLTGCKRGPGLFESAGIAVAQAAEVAKTANLIALKVQGMMNGGGGGAAGGKMMANANQTLASINGLTSKLNEDLAPGGSLDMTLANVRDITGNAKGVDIAQINATLVQARETVAQLQALLKSNKANLDTLMGQGAAASQESRAMLENLSGSLVTTSGNLERTTESLDALTQRLADDPTFAIRGKTFKDPPPPKAAP